MSDPDPPQPHFTGAGHKAFVGEPASDPFEFLQESSSTHGPESKLSFPLSGSQMQPSLAFDSGGRGKGGISPLTQAPLVGDHQVARLASLAESDGGHSPGILPSPTSAFSPYHVDSRHALPSLLQDPSEIMFSNVTILTPSPVPLSPDKKEAPPKTATPAQPVSSHGHVPTAPLMSHPDSVTAVSELLQPVSSAPTGTPPGEVLHPLPGIEVTHPHHGVEVTHPQRQVEEFQQQVEALPAQHQVQMPRPQRQVEEFQQQVEALPAQHQVQMPRPQRQVEEFQQQVEALPPQHQVQMPRPQRQVEEFQQQVETLPAQHQVQMPRPQQQTEVLHPQFRVELPHPQPPVELPHPQPRVELPHPQPRVELPHPQPQVELRHPQPQVEVPHPQHRGTIPNTLHQEDPSAHLQHLTSHTTLAPSGAKGTALSPNPPTRLLPATAPPPDTSSSRPVEARGLTAFGDHPSDHQLAATLPTEGLQSLERAPAGVVYEMGISRQASEGFPLEPIALQPSQPRPSGSHALHSSTILETPVERSSGGLRPDQGTEGFGEHTPLSDIHSSRDGAYHSVRPVPYDGASHDHSDRHSYYEGERGRPPYHEEWSRYNRPRYSSRHYHERDRGHYYGNHGYQQDHHGNHRHHHYARHHYDYDPSYHYHYGDWEYAWQQQQDRNQHYDSRYIDPRQRGYPYDYWRGRDRRRDPQYSGQDSSSLYDASQSWVDPASISHISDYGHSGYDTMSYTDGHTRDDYLYDQRYEGWEGDNPGNYPTEEWIQKTAGYPASEPARETPLLFAQPHAPARFGVGGVLLVVTPTIPSQYASATVEVHALQEIVPEYRQFAASVESSPGPLVPGETPKSSVASFVAEEAARSRETSEKAEDEESREGWRERALLWEYLLLLCRQNGVVVPSDLSELLTKDAGIHAASFDLALPSNDAPPSEKLHQFRMLILSGRKKDALDHACRQGLWGHALMVAMTMEEQSRQYVVNRFTASLLSSDPLNTFYTLMLGRMPTVSKPEGLTRGGDWRPHLSVMLSNRNTSDSKAAIVSLGDSLRSRGRLFAAHFCYKVAEVEFDGYGDRSCRYILLGVDPRTLDVGQYPSLNQLAMTEVYEYAMTLGQKNFSLPKFQLLKFLHIWKLVEAGLPVKALGYCEVTANSCLKCPELINPSALYQLAELSVRLHFHVHGGGVVHSELPQWIIELCRVIPFQDSKQEGHTLPKASPAPPPQSNSARDSPVTSGHFGDSTGHAPQPVDAGDGEEYPPEDLLMPGSSSQVSVHSSVSQQQQQQEDHAYNGWGHQEDPQSAAAQPPPQGPATLSQPPAPDGYSHIPTGYGVLQNHEPTTAAVGGLYQDHHGYGQQQYSQQAGAQQGFGVPPIPSHTVAPHTPMSGAPPPQGHVTASQGHMTGAPPPQGHTAALQGHMTGAPPPQGYTAAPQGHVTALQGHMTGAPPPQGYTAAPQGHLTAPQSHMTGAPPSQGHAYAPPGPNAAGGYSTMLTPVNPQPFAEPSLPPRNQDRQQADLVKPKDEDEDPGKGEDSSKTSSGGVMHFFRNLFPKKGGMHLPDDKPESKKIVWDPEKKKWIDKEAREESTDAPPPPPTDMQLQSMHQQQPFVMMPPGEGMSGPGALNQGGSMSGPGALNQAAPGFTASQRYGLKSRRTQAKYVDVFGGSKTSSQTAPPPPVMPLGGGTYSGNFFVPTAAGSADGLGESMAYFSGSEQPFPTENTADQPS